MLQKNFNVEIIFVVCFISASSSWHHRHHDRGISDFTVTQNRTHLCCSHSIRSSSFASLVQCSRHQLLDLVAIDVSRGRVVSTDKLRVVSSAKSVEKQEAVLTIADERWRRSQNISRVTDSAPLPPTTANNLWRGGGCETVEGGRTDGTSVYAPLTPIRRTSRREIGTEQWNHANDETSTQRDRPRRGSKTRAKTHH